MIRGAIATGLAGLGLVGGAAVVTYDDDGNAKVTISKDGESRSVKIKTDQSGGSYFCPPAAEKELTALTKRSGRIKLTIRDVRTELRQIDADYPGPTAPGPVVRRYNGLIDREKELVGAFNGSVGDYNLVLERECDAE